MNEKTTTVQIADLLPGVDDQADSCPERLSASLRTRQGIAKSHLDTKDDGLALCLHYDSDQLSEAEVKRIARHAASNINRRYHHRELRLQGMDCSDCAMVIEHSLRRMPGVLTARVDYPGQRVAVEYDRESINRRKIERRIRSLGYDVEQHPALVWLQVNRELLFSLLAGLSLLAAYFGARLFGFPLIASNLLYAAAYLLGGSEVLIHSLRSLKQRRFDIDTLMLVAALGAAALGDFAEGALLLFLFSLGHALEERLLDRAKGEIRSLADLAPKVAIVVRDGAERLLPVEQVALADLLVVRPGVRFPVDGVIEAGQTEVNEAPVTGESLPVEKSPGDRVYAGSINGSGAVHVRATRLAEDSTLRRIAGLVASAQAGKTVTQQAIDRLVKVYVPLVLISALLVTTVPLLFGVPFRVAFLRAMTLLVASSPCALALGTPATMLTGIAQAARRGILAKGGAHLENLGSVRLIAFDKTGTLTIGKPALTDIISLNNHSEVELLKLAAAVEAHSAHPLAAAVVQAARERGLLIPMASDSTTFSGLGAQAQVGGDLVLVGGKALFHSRGIHELASASPHIDLLEGQGKTAVLVAVGDEIVGVLGIADPVRPEAPLAIKALRDLGVGDTLILSGDNPQAAERIAAETGVSGFRASLLPEEKLQALRELGEQYGNVAMVGDGVNDAPALAAATVGIAMGGSATDVALETAGIALLSPDLTRLPYAISLGRMMARITRQNLVVAFGVIAVLSVLAVSGLAGIGIAVLIHEGSTLLVVANALRLLGYQPAG